MFASGQRIVESMELVITQENPAPPHAVVTTIRAVDAIALRVARWHPPGHPVGTVVICAGRAQCIEHYFETISDLLRRAFVVVAFDWRGQGMSERELKNPLKGHIDDFSLYERDLAALAEQVLEPFCPKPWFALGHSMGATILLGQARGGRCPFERLVLSAPLIDFHGLRWRQGARFLVECLDITGFGGAFIPLHRQVASFVRPFAGNPLTSDPDRYARNAAVIAAEPRLALGAPTIGWVNAAFRRIKEFANPEYPRRTQTPILVIAAGSDRIADCAATERFATRLKAGRLVVIPYAQHELLAERDHIREQFWAAFDAFVPGTRDEVEALAAAHLFANATRRRWPWSRARSARQ